MNESIIQVRNLIKSYGKHSVLQNLTFDIAKGQITAVLGPNGAGKSTLLNILSTELPFEEGEIYIAGNKLGSKNKIIRKNIGIVFQNGILDERLTVSENLRVRGGFYGLRGNELSMCINKVVKLTNIERLIESDYGILSGGQKRRCDIARALIHDPYILFLDEPSSGLDPEMRKMVWQAVERIKTETGMTVVMTTHYMEEAALADNIIIINKGTVFFQGTSDEIKERFAKSKLILYSGNKKTELGLSNTKEALTILYAIKNSYDDFEVIKGTMESAYMSIIGEEIL